MSVVKFVSVNGCCQLFLIKKLCFFSFLLPEQPYNHSLKIAKYHMASEVMHASCWS